MLQNAVAEGAKISTVNIMTFDYYLGTTENMLKDAESAATAAHPASSPASTPACRRGRCGR